MTQQVINIGTMPDDGTGDQLPVAFDKANDNFTELYAADATLQPLDADLTALAALTGTNDIYFRSAANTWSAVTIGSNLTFSAGTLSADAPDLSGYALLASPTFTGDPKAPTPATADNDTSIATTAFVKAQGYLVAADISGKADLASPTFTGDPKAPTPATGDNDTSIATTAFVKAQGYLVTSDLSAYAPLASPTFTGDPKAPTPATADNDTSIATTAYVQSNLASYAPLASPTFTGDAKAPTPSPGDNDTSIATTAFVTAAVAAAVTISQPQGRPTLQSGTPVMTTTQAAKTTLYYTPYWGNRIPIWDGTSWTMRSFSEISVATTDTTKNPAAIGANKVNDWYVWDDAGTLRLVHNVDWTNDTTRAAGGAHTTVDGIVLNTSAITNGPAASRATWVATTRSNGSSQLDWIYGALAAGGTAGWFGLWSAYNRIRVMSFVAESTDSWTQATTMWRSARAVNTMRHSFVSGVAEDAFAARNYAINNGGGICGIGYDVTNSYFGSTGVGNGNGSTLVAEYATAALGFHFFQATEYAVSSTTWYGDDGTAIRSGLWFEGWM